MSRRRRASTAGLAFHILNRSAKRVRLFDTAADYDAFERLLVAAISRGRVSLYSYCLMPNHWHLIASPRCDGELSRFMHWLTTAHARRWQMFRGTVGQGAVYQGRYKAIVVKHDHHFLRVCRYVERNAVRASLVSRADEWRWGSLWQRTEGDSSWLSDWPVTRPADWHLLVDQPQTRNEIAAVRRSIRSGEPMGDSEWVRQLGLKGARPAGRPRRSVLEK